MTAYASFSRIVDEWLHAEAPTHAPREVLTTALERVAQRGQDRYITQRVFGDEVGRSATLRFVGLAAMTALMVVALAFSAVIVGRRPAQPVVPPPVATPTLVAPTQTPAPPSAAGAFVPGPELLVGRGSHTTTQLLDGRVLVIGGQTHPDAMVPLTDSTELWNPNDVGDDFVRGAVPLDGRAMHTATLLPDGRVLVVGGYWWDEVSGEITLSAAEIWDPRDGSFNPAGDLGQGRHSHSATLLSNGRVLIAGGWSTDFQEPVAALEVWDPVTSTFSAAGSVANPDGDQYAIPLGDGRVMFVGEQDTEVWDPSTTSLEPGPRLIEPRYNYSATLLIDGRVLVAGGMWGSNQDIVVRESAEVWDPSTNALRLIHPLQAARAGHRATLLADGRVLLSGGDEPSTFEIWDPASEDSGVTGATIENRNSGGTATLLNDGRVLLVGNMSRQGISTTTEIWDAAAEPLPPPPPTPEPDVTPTPPPVQD